VVEKGMSSSKCEGEEKQPCPLTEWRKDGSFTLVWANGEKKLGAGRGKDRGGKDSAAEVKIPGAARALRGSKN